MVLDLASDGQSRVEWYTDPFGVQYTVTLILPFTVTLQAYFLLPILAVTVAVPAFFPVTTPLDETAATAELLEDQTAFCVVSHSFKPYFTPALSEMDVFDR